MHKKSDTITKSAKSSRQQSNFDEWQGQPTAMLPATNAAIAEAATVALSRVNRYHADMCVYLCDHTYAQIYIAIVVGASLPDWGQPVL